MERLIRALNSNAWITQAFSYPKSYPRELDPTGDPRALRL
jgi:hypothetical protein